MNKFTYSYPTKVYFGEGAAADALNDRQAGGRYRYFVSDRQEDFSRLASIFLGWDVTEAVGQVDIAAF